MSNEQKDAAKLAWRMDSARRYMTDGTVEGMVTALGLLRPLDEQVGPERAFELRREVLRAGGFVTRSVTA